MPMKALLAFLTTMVSTGRGCASGLKSISDAARQASCNRATLISAWGLYSVPRLHHHVLLTVLALVGDRIGLRMRAEPSLTLS